MPRLVILGLALLVLVAAATGGWAEPAADDTSVAVSAGTAPPLGRMLMVGLLPFEARDESTSAAVTEAVAAGLSADARLGLVERSRLGQVLAELGLGKTGALEPASAQQVGYLAGADVLMWGRVFVIGRQVMATVRIVGVETGRVFVEQVRGSSADDLLSLTDQLARNAAQRISRERAALRAPAARQGTQAALNALAGSLQGKALPKVAVSVAEVAGASPGSGSAAATELLYWLVRCGFPTVEAPAGAPLVLTGEAGSEPAGTYGPLHAVRYRMQVKVTDPATGEVLAVARRTGACADVTDAAAAQTGLQRAAASIAGELIPKLSTHAPSPGAATGSSPPGK